MIMKVRMAIMIALAVLAGAVYTAAGDILPVALSGPAQVSEAGLSNCEAYEYPHYSNKAWADCMAYAGPNTEWVRVQGQCFQKTNPFVIITVSGRWTSLKWPSSSGATCPTATHDLFKVRYQLLNQSGVIIVTSVWFYV